MTKSTFRLLETVLRLPDEEKKKCLQYYERAIKELTEERDRLRGEEDADAQAVNDAGGE